MRKKLDDLARLLAKCIPGEDGCWMYTGCRDGRYGRIRIGRRKWYAHRASYALHKGEIPDGLEIDHLCHKPLCVNPEHLEAVTRDENQRRALTEMARRRPFKPMPPSPRHDWSSGPPWQKRA
jgi:hypothetical protein